MATHHFEPTRYYNTLGSHEPALRIAPGDTVVTTTVDAWGQDASGTKVTQGPNPQTGPFYVDGAKPGDTLVVHLDRLTPNRPTGWGRPTLSQNTIEPEYVYRLPDPTRQQVITWQVDNRAGTATLLDSGGKPASVVLPLEPMLGCFGVAPFDAQAISAMTSGQHGGNMDYRGFVSGVTAYFPVFMPGALFTVGDGHALQGDGEMNGTGIEISFEAQFTVELLQGRPSEWPRGENAEYIFTLGNARPLDQAVQHATTEMLRWLQADYGLSMADANLLMGYCVRYDLGNMYDPAYTMVCKMPKRFLPNRVA